MFNLSCRPNRLLVVQLILFDMFNMSNVPTEERESRITCQPPEWRLFPFVIGGMSPEPPDECRLIAGWFYLFSSSHGMGP